tara:strand:+ start:1442 stop:1606 length:165 start_codon:yes stop_codon:yes gene_type:complete
MKTQLKRRRWNPMIQKRWMRGRRSEDRPSEGLQAEGLQAEGLRVGEDHQIADRQ